MNELFSLLVPALPVLLVLVLANLADRTAEDWSETDLFLGRWAVGLLAGIYVLMVLVGGGLQVAFIRLGQGVPPGWLPPDMGMVQAITAGEVASTRMVAAAFWLPGLLGLLLLLPRMTQGAARLLPLDPSRWVHRVALALTPLVLANLMITLGVGLGNLSDLLANGDGANLGLGAETFVAVWGQQLLWALAALIGVGWLTRRDLAASLHRLGLTRPSAQGILVAVGLSMAAVFGVIILQGMGALLGFGPDPEVTELSEQLIGPLTQSLAGILTLGLAAALGEETLLRGALQPRFGLVATAVLFALLHSNYGITFSTLVVFLLGLLLGWVRRHYNTATSMIVHALYNMSLGALAYLAARLIQ